MHNPLQFLPDFSHQNDTSEVLTFNPNFLSWSIWASEWVFIPPHAVCAEARIQLFSKESGLETMVHSWWLSTVYIGLDSRRFCLYLQSIEFWKAGLPINYYSHLVPSPTIPILSWFLNASHAFSKRFSTMEIVSARPHNIFTMAPKVAEWCFNLLTCRLFAACTAACANHNKMIKMTPHDDQKGGVWILYNAF